MKNKHIIASPSDFDGKVTPSIESSVLREAIFKCDDREMFAQEVKAQYDSELRLVMTLGGSFGLETLSGQWSVKFDGTDNRFIPLLSLSSSLKSDGNGFVSLIPKEEPLKIDFGGDISRFEVSVVNGPPLYIQDFEPVFDVQGLQVKFREFDFVRQLRKDAQLLRRDNVFTGILEIESSSGEISSLDETLKLINRIQRYLTFVRGGYVGLGHAIGYTETEEVSCAAFGFTPTDFFEWHRGWYGIGIVNNIAPIFDLFDRATSNETDQYIILRCLEFCRASNAARYSSQEMAIVAAHAALESIVPHILRSRGGWSTKLLENRDIEFSEKSRAASNLIGVYADVLEHSPELRKLSKSRNNMDAFQVISFVRNKIVHADEKLKLSGLQLEEAWRITLWLAELFMIYLIGYREKMYDRRRYTGYYGPEVPVPIK